MKQTTKLKETEIGMIPEDWEVYSLEDISEIIDCLHSKKPEKKNSGEVYLEVFNLVPETAGINLSNLEFISKEDYLFWTKRTIPEYGDLVITNTGIAATAMIPKNFKCCIGRNMTLIKPNRNKILPEFLRFYTLSNFFKSEIKRLSLSGTILESLHVKYIGKIKIAVPKLEEQQKIVNIIEPFFDKSVTNHQMGRTFEYIGQALFKRWFVDFEFPNEKGKPYKSSDGKMIDSELGEIPNGWKVGVFSDFVDNTKEPLKPGDHLKDRKYVPIDCLAMRSIGIEDYKDFSEAKSSLIAFEKGDILFGAMRAYFHRVNLAPFPGITRTTTFVLRPKKKQYLSYALFLLNQDASVEYANAHSKGSTMPYAVWEGSLSEMPILLPDERIIEKFYIVLYSMLEKISNLIFENENLKEIHDFLLPRLMSGKIRVPTEARA
jgi:type I restriction enzyme S subunit